MGFEDAILAGKSVTVLGDFSKERRVYCLIIEDDERYRNPTNLTPKLRYIRFDMRLDMRLRHFRMKLMDQNCFLCVAVL